MAAGRFGPRPASGGQEVEADHLAPSRKYLRTYRRYRTTTTSETAVRQTIAHRPFGPDSRIPIGSHESRERAHPPGPPPIEVQIAESVHSAVKVSVPHQPSRRSR